MPVIRISDEVFAALQQHAVPLSDTPDSVLRRLLGLDGDAARHEGKLAPLMDAGLLHAGDRLIWNQPRVGNTYYVTVLDGGAVQLEDGRVAASLSGACRDLTGKSFDGWEEFRRESDGTLLDDLRATLSPTPRRKSS